MIEEQPTLFRANGHRAGSRLGALPGAVREGSGTHHKTMVSPKIHVGRIAQPNIAEGRVAAVRGSGEHGITSVDFFGEEHAVAIEGQEGIFALEELLKVERVTDTDGGTTAEAVAPSNPIAVVNPHHAWVVLVEMFGHGGISAGSGLEVNGLVVDAPVDAVGRETGKNVHLHTAVVAAEHAGKTLAVAHHSRVENGVA